MLVVSLGTGEWVRRLILAGDLGADQKALWLSVFAGIFVVGISSFVELGWSLHSMWVDRREAVQVPDDPEKCREHLQLAIGHLSWWRKRIYNRELRERAENR